MRTDDLLDAIGEAREEYVQAVRTAKRNIMPRWAKWTSSIAACLVLLLGAGLIFSKIGGKAIPIHCGLFDDIDVSNFGYENKIIPEFYKEIKL